MGVINMIFESWLLIVISVVSLIASLLLSKIKSNKALTVHILSYVTLFISFIAGVTGSVYLISLS